ncbi:MAG: 16S rRNA (guanine(966)-N(2))-methyltransferase RsmD [Quisquiliibacterium sp.]
MSREQSAHKVRISGGQWKRTPLPVPDVPGLRPTPDRVRETLFNWLGQDLEGLHCLDLFAGTGALGLEAASRGAAQVWLVETDRRAQRGIDQVLAKLAAAQVRLLATDAFLALSQARAAGCRFDLVFLDPPFAMGWLEKVLPGLAPVLGPHALLYIEAERTLEPGELEQWLGAPAERLKADRAGQVFYHLFRMRNPDESQP